MKHALAALATAAMLVTYSPGASNAAAVHTIAGGKFEASGAMFVDGGVLFVDDGRPNQLFLMTLDENGRQVGSVDVVPFGVAVRDMEGMTSDGEYLYVVGSQSKKDSQPGVGLARFKFDARAKRVSNVESIADLKTLVFEALPDVKHAAGTKVDGFNIEGLAWDAHGRRLLLGLRAPVVNGQALVIPLQVPDGTAPLKRDKVRVVADQVTRLSLEGAGIRSLEYDGTTKAYRVISGAPANREGSFGLWRWDGRRALERERTDAQMFDRALKPEGITRVAVGTASYTFIVFDTGRYVTMQ